MTMSAIISRTNDCVINVLDLNPTDHLPDDVYAIASDAAKIGDKYDQATGTFSAPPAPPPVSQVPQEVSAAQAKVALHNAGLLDAIQTYVDASTDPTLKIAWASASAFRRDGLLVTQLAPQFNLDAAALDALFTAAGAIQL